MAHPLEAYDFFKSHADAGAAGPQAPIPIETLIRKLDSDFFNGRGSRATDRQRELLLRIANLENADREFSVSRIVETAQATMTEQGAGLSRRAMCRI